MPSVTHPSWFVHLFLHFVATRGQNTRQFTVAHRHKHMASCSKEKTFYFALTALLNNFESLTNLTNLILQQMMS